MAKRIKKAEAGKSNGIADLIKELWQAAVNLRGAIEPENATWEYIRAHARDDDIKVKLDEALEALEDAYPDKLRGLLPRIYAGSRLDAENVRGLINLFSKDVFSERHNGADLIGRTYEYFNKTCDKINDKIVETIHENRTLFKIRDTLPPKLMTGKIRIKNSEKIVGEAV